LLAFRQCTRPAHHLFLALGQLLNAPFHVLKPVAQPATFLVSSKHWPASTE
jgi:hypothetical protein